MIESIDLETRRLVCFNNFCRYYLGLKGHLKPCEWIYIPKETADLLKISARNNVIRYAKRHGLVLLKMMRNVAWRLMVQAM